jgi:hypothetical protein
MILCFGARAKPPVKPTRVGISWKNLTTQARVAIRLIFIYLSWVYIP